MLCSVRTKERRSVERLGVDSPFEKRAAKAASSDHMSRSARQPQESKTLCSNERAMFRRALFMLSAVQCVRWFMRPLRFLASGERLTGLVRYAHAPWALPCSEVSAFLRVLGKWLQLQHTRTFSRQHHRIFQFGEISFHLGPIRGRCSL